MSGRYKTQICSKIYQTNFGDDRPHFSFCSQRNTYHCGAP